MEALTALTHLSKCLPLWFNRLEELSQLVKARYEESLRVSTSITTTTGPVLKKTKSSSNESLRPAREDDQDLPISPISTLSTPFPAPPTPIQQSTPTPALASSQPAVQRTTSPNIDPSSRHLFHDRRMINRFKRLRTPSLLSNISSSQQQRGSRARSSSLVVYYDSSIQTSFEYLSRAVSGARNILIKGKKQTKARAMMKILAMKDPASVIVGDGVTIGDGVQVGLTDPVTRDVSRPGGLDDERATDDVWAAFDDMDKHLEAAQTMCELGAHQFLREGECLQDLQGIKERFERLSTAVQAWISVLRREEEERAASEGTESGALVLDTAYAVAAAKLEERTYMLMDGHGVSDGPVSVAVDPDMIDTIDTLQTPSSNTEEPVASPAVERTQDNAGHRGIPDPASSMAVDSSQAVASAVGPSISPAGVDETRPPFPLAVDESADSGEYTVSLDMAAFRRSRQTPRR